MRIEVTAEHIAQAREALTVGERATTHCCVAVALKAAGVRFRSVGCLVVFIEGEATVRLPDAVGEKIAQFMAGEAVEPFSFEWPGAAQ
jgi:hypothetical protein